MQWPIVAGKQTRQPHPSGLALAALLSARKSIGVERLPRIPNLVDSFLRQFSFWGGWVFETKQIIENKGCTWHSVLVCELHNKVARGAVRIPISVNVSAPKSPQGRELSQVLFKNECGSGEAP
jgi:hypothetical protein